jgi:hypothetical protein|eukprot:COSAG06_NODE_6294_length_2994_cov_2.603109_1_plen_181_part_00
MQAAHTRRGRRVERRTIAGPRPTERCDSGSAEPRPACWHSRALWRAARRRLRALAGRRLHPLLRLLRLRLLQLLRLLRLRLLRLRLAEPAPADRCALRVSETDGPDPAAASGRRWVGTPEGEERCAVGQSPRRVLLHLSGSTNDRRFAAEALYRQKSVSTVAVSSIDGAWAPQAAPPRLE